MIIQIMKKAVISLQNLYTSTSTSVSTSWVNLLWCTSKEGNKSCRICFSALWISKYLLWISKYLLQDKYFLLSYYEHREHHIIHNINGEWGHWHQTSMSRKWNHRADSTWLHLVISGFIWFRLSRSAPCRPNPPYNNVTHVIAKISITKHDNNTWYHGNNNNNYTITTQGH